MMTKKKRKPLGPRGANGSSNNGNGSHKGNGNGNGNGKPKRGRPSPYRPEYAELAGRACEIFGAMDIDIARMLGVSKSTLNLWKIKHPEFSDSLKVGKAVCDRVIEEALYHRAKGYSFEAVKFFVIKGKVVRQTYIEHVPPDAVSMIFYLKNRLPHLYRDKRDPDEDRKNAESPEVRRDRAIDKANRLFASFDSQEQARKVPRKPN